MIKDEAEDPNKLNFDDNVRSYITFNKGGKWQLLKAPLEDSKGQKHKCFIEDGCSLHM